MLPTNNYFKAFEMFEHGRVAYELEMYQISIDWMEKVIEKPDDQKELIEIEHPFKYLAYAYMRIGKSTISVDIVNFLVSIGD